MVQIFLGGLAQGYKRYRPMRMTICMREKPPTFFNFQFMLMVKENHAGASSNTHSDSQILYTEADRPCGRGEHGGPGCNVNGRQKQNQRHNRHADNSSEPSTSSGNQGSTRIWKRKAATDCQYYGLKGHRESECWKKQTNSDKSESDIVEQGNRQ